MRWVRRRLADAAALSVVVLAGDAVEATPLLEGLLHDPVAPSHARALLSWPLVQTVVLRDTDARTATNICRDVVRYKPAPRVAVCTRHREKRVHEYKARVRVRALCAVQRSSVAVQSCAERTRSRARRVCRGTRRPSRRGATLCTGRPEHTSTQCTRHQCEECTDGVESAGEALCDPWACTRLRIVSAAVREST
jgi:hypothetical protein